MSHEDRIRHLLTDYHRCLALARELALKLLDVVQVDAPPVSTDAGREARRLVGESLAQIDAGEEQAEALWKQLRIDRRTRTEDPSPFDGHPNDRRRVRRRKP